MQARYQSVERRSLEASLRLGEEYRRVTQQYQDLQFKFRRFQLADVSKRNKVKQGPGGCAVGWGGGWAGNAGAVAAGCGNLPSRASLGRLRVHPGHLMLTSCAS